MSEARTVPGHQLSNRLFRRAEGRAKVGPKPAFFQRMGLQNPYAAAPATAGARDGGMTFLSAAAYYDDVSGMSAFHRRMMARVHSVRHDRVSRRIRSMDPAAFKAAPTLSADEPVFLSAPEPESEEETALEAVERVAFPRSIPRPKKVRPIDRVYAQDGAQVDSQVQAALVELAQGLRGDERLRVEGMARSIRGMSQERQARAIRSVTRDLKRRVAAPVARQLTSLAEDEAARPADVAKRRMDPAAPAQRGLRRVLGSSPAITTLEQPPAVEPAPEEHVQPRAPRGAEVAPTPVRRASAFRSAPASRAAQDARAQATPGRAGPPDAVPSKNLASRVNQTAAVRPTERIARAANYTPSAYETHRGTAALTPAPVTPVERMALREARTDVAVGASSVLPALRTARPVAPAVAADAAPETRPSVRAFERLSAPAVTLPETTADALAYPTRPIALSVPSFELATAQGVGEAEVDESQETPDPVVRTVSRPARVARNQASTRAADAVVSRPMLRQSAIRRAARRAEVASAPGFVPSPVPALARRSGPVPQSRRPSQSDATAQPLRAGRAPLSAGEQRQAYVPAAPMSLVTPAMVSAAPASEPEVAAGVVGEAGVPTSALPRRSRGVIQESLPAMARALRREEAGRTLRASSSLLPAIVPSAVAGPAESSVVHAEARLAAATGSQLRTQREVRQVASEMSYAVPAAAPAGSVEAVGGQPETQDELATPTPVRAVSRRVPAPRRVEAARGEASAEPPAVRPPMTKALAPEARRASPVQRIAARAVPESREADSVVPSLALRETAERAAAFTRGEPAVRPVATAAALPAMRVVTPTEAPESASVESESTVSDSVSRAASRSERGRPSAAQRRSAAAGVKPTPAVAAVARSLPEEKAERSIIAPRPRMAQRAQLADATQRAVAVPMTAAPVDPAPSLSATERVLARTLPEQLSRESRSTIPSAAPFVFTTPAVETDQGEPLLGGETYGSAPARQVAPVRGARPAQRATLRRGGQQQPAAPADVARPAAVAPRAEVMTRVLRSALSEALSTGKVVSREQVVERVSNAMARSGDARLIQSAPVQMVLTRLAEQALEVQAEVAGSDPGTTARPAARVMERRAQRGVAPSAPSLATALGRELPSGARRRSVRSTVPRLAAAQRAQQRAVDTAVTLPAARAVVLGTDLTLATPAVGSAPDVGAPAEVTTRAPASQWATARGGSPVRVAQAPGRRALAPRQVGVAPRLAASVEGTFVAQRAQVGRPAEPVTGATTPRLSAERSVAEAPVRPGVAWRAGRSTAVQPSSTSMRVAPELQYAAAGLPDEVADQPLGIGGSATRPARRGPLSETLSTLDSDMVPVGQQADSPAWARRATEGTAAQPVALAGAIERAISRAPGGLLAALARADRPEDVVRVIAERGSEATTLARELPGGAADMVEQIARQAGPAAKQGGQARRGGRRRSNRTQVVTRQILRPNQARRTPSGGGATMQGQNGVGSNNVMKLADKLMGLIHLAENERRVRDAQDQVRMAEDTASARAEGGQGSASGSAGENKSMNIKALQRQVLEGVLRELELAGERREDDPDGRSFWW